MTAYQSYEWNLLLFQEWHNSLVERLSGRIYVYILFKDDEPQIICPIIYQHISSKTRWSGRKSGVYILGHNSYSDYLNLIYLNTMVQQIDLLINRLKSDFPHKKCFFTDIEETVSLSQYFKNENVVPTAKKVAVAIYRKDSAELYSKSLTKHTRQNLRTALNRINSNGFKYEFRLFGIIHDKEMLEHLRIIHITRMKNKDVGGKTAVHRIAKAIRMAIKKAKEYKNNIIYSSMQQMSNSCVVVAYLNDEIVGYLYGLQETDGIRIMQNCFDDKYKYYSPLFRCAYDFIVKTYEWPSIKWVDFTRGNEKYKYMLGGEETQLFNYIL